LDSRAKFETARSKQPGLKRFSEFFSKGAVGAATIRRFSRTALFSASRRTRFHPGASGRAAVTGRRSPGCNRGATGPASLCRHRSLSPGFRRLRGIGAKQTVLQGRTVETADNRIHLLRIRRVDEREALRLLRFRVADYLNSVRDQVFGGQPAPDIVRSHPSGQIAQKDRKTHSLVIFDSIGGGLLRGQGPRRHFNATTV